MARRDETGLSLAELMIASLLTLVVLLMGYGVLTTTTKTAATVAARAQNSTEARLTVDALEASLRFANGVWLCAPVTATPQAVTSATVACPPPTTATALEVSTDSGCREWILSSSGTGALSEVALATPANAMFTVTPVASTAGVRPWTTTSGTLTAGFSLPLAPSQQVTSLLASSQRLVQLDLTVNEQTGAAYSSGNSVTVHDLIAPDNITTQDSTSVTPCS
jgi:Tfp pilus assembly protein PilW